MERINAELLAQTHEGRDHVQEGGCLQYEAIVSGGDEKSAACDGDLGKGVSFGMEMLTDMRRMGMFWQKNEPPYLIS